MLHYRSLNKLTVSYGKVVNNHVNMKKKKVELLIFHRQIKKIRLTKRNRPT